MQPRRMLAVLGKIRMTVIGGSTAREMTGAISFVKFPGGKRLMGIYIVGAIGTMPKLDNQHSCCFVQKSSLGSTLTVC